MQPTPSTVSAPHKYRLLEKHGIQNLSHTWVVDARVCCCVAETVSNDVAAINLVLDAGGAFALLASGAANMKYLTLQRQDKRAKPAKKES